MTNSSPPHLLLVPYPLQGHIIPAVQLALRLAAAGFSITFANTESVDHRTALARRHLPTSGGDIFTGARAGGLDIRYETVSDGLPIDFDRSLHHDEFMSHLLCRFQGYVESLIGRLPPVAGLVADTFFVWPATLARSLGVPYVSFWTEPALVFSLYYHLDLLRHNGHYGSKENRTDTITYVPGVSGIEPCDLMSYLQDSDTSTVVHQIINRAFDEAHRADFVVCNTVQDLEPEAAVALAQLKPFYAVGPIFPIGFAVPTSLLAESDCSAWLDSRPAGSVLYISFGSYAHVSEAALREIARGVASSRVSFLWAARPDLAGENEMDPLPAGFREETQERGAVVQWCRQAEVLSHAAVGGFLSHCGWNSVMESLWCGVPMLCFPLLTDQLTNRKLVVEDWKAGLDLGEIKAESVGEKIHDLMGGGKGEILRERAKKVSGIMRAALEDGGSSNRNFDRFVCDLKCRVKKKEEAVAGSGRLGIMLNS